MTGNCPRRGYSAIDINRSGTRREELLLNQKEIESIWAIRKAMSNLGPADVTEMIEQADADKNER